MEKKVILSIWIIATFLIAHYGWEVAVDWGWISAEWPQWIRQLIGYILIPLGAPLLFLWLSYGPKQLARELGLDRGLGTATRVAFIATLPMLLGYAWLSGGKMQISAETFLIGCVLAAFREEIIYRAFLFGQLFRRAGWGFLPAGLAAAVIFGTGHLYQGNDPASLIGIFAVTFAGGLWFAWMYIEWDENLWVPMLFHFLMNFYWSLFQVGENALGGVGPNVFRIATIVLSVILTRRYIRRRGSARINRDTLFFHRQAGKSAELQGHPA